MTDRTHEPSQDQRRTARHPQSSTEEMVARLRKDGENKAADLLTRLSAERDRLAETAAEFEEATHQWEREASRVKAERDKAEADLSALKARVAELEGALRSVKSDIEDEHGHNRQSIVCTVWHDGIETTVDFIENALTGKTDEPSASTEGRRASTCQCQACATGTQHLSSCAVHNAPALPIGSCDCGEEERS